MKKIAYIALIASALLLSSGLGVGNNTSTGSFGKKQIYSSKEIVNQLTYWHYSKNKFDDSLSSKLFDNFLGHIDPRRQILLRSDIEAFAAHKTELDNNIKRGNLDFSREVFDVYKKRLSYQLEKTLADWPLAIESFDFSKNEKVLIDRSEAAYPANQKEADNLWRKHIKAMILDLQLADKSKADTYKILKKRLERQLSNLKQQDSNDVFRIYMNSLTELYDPHTNFLSPQNSENFNINMSLKLQGIGAVLQHKDEDVTVVRLVAGGPADKQGELRPNDKIVAVAQGKNGEFIDVVGWQLDDVVNLIRGKPKSSVRLEIVRGSSNSNKNKVIQIIRDNVKLEDQSAKKAVITLPGDNNNNQKIGVIKIPTFYMDFDAYRRGNPNYKSTTRDVAKLISELEQENINGIVIDLRDNGGGSLHEAEELTSLFIEQGPVVQIRHSNNNVSYKGKRLRTKYYQGPIVVLINRLSASASEIFAAAIQDYQRGLIIGEQSYGKGTVQTLKELPYGHLKLTESKFYRISGESTQHRGVIPDIALPSVYDKDEIGESTLEHALKWDKIGAAQHNTYANFSPIIDSLTSRYMARIQKDPDFIFQGKYADLINRKETYLSLNKAARELKNKTDDTQFLAIENARRKSKGEKEFASITALEEENEKKLEEKNRQSNSTQIDIESDFFLLETARILLDANNLISAKCQTLQYSDCNNPVVKNIISRSNQAMPFHKL